VISVEGDGDEANRSVVDGDKDVAVRTRAGGSDCVGLLRFPIRVQPQEDRVAELAA